MEGGVWGVAGRAGVVWRCGGGQEVLSMAKLGEEPIGVVFSLLESGLRLSC